MGGYDGIKFPLPGGDGDAHSDILSTRTVDAITLPTTTQKEADVVYDLLSGRRIKASEMQRHGIYFVNGKKVLKFEKAPVAYATVSSVLSGGAYIVTLFTAAVLPVVITSPLGTGIGILMSSFLPWITYHEKLEKKQLWGVALSFVGVLVYLINM